MHNLDGAARLAINADPQPGGVRVRPRGEICLATVDRIRRYIDQCVAAGWKRVVLDLHDVTFIDSTGLHLILEIDAAARAAEWELRLIEDQPACSEYSSLPASARRCHSSKRHHPLSNRRPDPRARRRGAAATAPLRSLVRRVAMR
jgi:anti-anti-sigma factor